MPSLLWTHRYCGHTESHSPKGFSSLYFRIATLATSDHGDIVLLLSIAQMLAMMGIAQMLAMMGIAQMLAMMELVARPPCYVTLLNLPHGVHSTLVVSLYSSCALFGRVNDEPWRR